MSKQLTDAAKKVIAVWDTCGRYPDTEADRERLDGAIDALRSGLVAHDMWAKKLAQTVASLSARVGESRQLMEQMAAALKAEKGGRR